MNIAVILAGGTGERLGAGKPKQFVEVFGKPLIAYTMEIYERSPSIDAIEVVSHPDWIDYVWNLAEKYNIKKLKWVCKGGSICQDSTRNGIFNLEGQVSDDDILMFVMSTSVFVSEEIIKDSIRVCRKYGNAFCCMQCIYNMAYTIDGKSSNHLEYKEEHKTINLPWSSTFGKLDKLYHKAYEQGIEIELKSYMPTLFLAMGETLYFSKDSSRNKLHVAFEEDLEMIKACFYYEMNNKPNEL